jgi:hypothetical protein
MMPNHSKPFQIESDASKYASGAVLTQTDINGDRHPVAFLSKTFTDMEQRYEIYDRKWNCTSFKGMATLYLRLRTHNNDTHGSLKPDLLPESTKTI